MLRNIKWNMLAINLCIDIVLIVLTFIFAPLENIEKIKVSLAFFGFGIISSIFMAIFLYVNFVSDEWRFQVFSIFFLFGAFISTIFMSINSIKLDYIFSLMIPIINIFFICLYSKVYIWKIDHNEFIEKRNFNRAKRKWDR